MKAISFLQCFNELVTQTYYPEHLIHYSTEYYKKVSQPFLFEKVVELFEGFEISKNSEHLDLFSTKLNAGFYYDKQYKDFYYLLNYNSYEINDILDEKHKSIMLRIYNEPKTIDEFIILCNNLNIKLQWK